VGIVAQYRRHNNVHRIHDDLRYQLDHRRLSSIWAEVSLFNAVCGKFITSFDCPSLTRWGARLSFWVAFFISFSISRSVCFIRVLVQQSLVSLDLFWWWKRHQRNHKRDLWSWSVACSRWRYSSHSNSSLPSTGNEGLALHKLSMNSATSPHAKPPWYCKRCVSDNSVLEWLRFRNYLLSPIVSIIKIQLNVVLS